MSLRTLGRFGVQLAPRFDAYTRGPTAPQRGSGQLRRSMVSS
jgi:hypothetical protein